MAAKPESNIESVKMADGRVVDFAGKRKLLLCGFHEATLAAFAAAERVFPGQPVHLQYTTTSPKLHKVLAQKEPSINGILARDKEFGWTSNFDGFHTKEKDGDVPLYYIRTMKRGVGFIERNKITKSAHLIDTWKVLVPQAYNGGDGIPHPILGKSLVAPSPSVCTQSFLFFYVANEQEAKSLQSYYCTRFFRFVFSH